jgi:hypothetical protein
MAYYRGYCFRRFILTQKMITYVKTGLDESVIKLLNKFEQTDYVSGLILAFENQAYSIRKVLKDDILVGIILFKGVNLSNGKCACEIIHVIAAENDSNFCEVLGESIEAFVGSMKIFDVIHFHVTTPVLMRIMNKFFVTPQECIYKRDLIQVKI